MVPKKILKKSVGVFKNTEFNADFESVEKLPKRFKSEKLVTVL
jgi:hypothetical protein